MTLQVRVWMAILYFLRNQLDHVTRNVRLGRIKADLCVQFSNRELLDLIRQADVELTAALFPALIRQGGTTKQ